MAAMTSPAGDPVNVPPGLYVPTADGRIVMSGLDWAGYQSLLALRGERSRPRLAYLDGAVELMSPSYGHETTGYHIGQVLVFYCLEVGIEISGHKSWTLNKQDDEAGAEPDECFIFGDHERSEHGWPDLVIEVSWTRGGIDKLEIYRRLGIPEVWFWEADALRVYVLRGGAYELQTQSQWVPDLDLPWLLGLTKLPTLNAIRDAVRVKLAR